MAGEPAEILEVKLVAEVQAMMDTVISALERVKENVSKFKGQVDLTASLDKLLGGLNDATGKINNWKAQADRAATVAPRIDPAPALSGLESLKGQFLAIGRVLTDWFYYVRAFQQLEGAIRACVGASDAQELALARLQTAVQNSASATEGMFERLKAQAGDLSKQFGFMGDEQIESAQAVLAGFGLTEDAIKKLTPVLLDMAAGLEKTSGQEQDLETLAKLVGKAMNGQGEALGRMGSQIDEARAKTDALGAVMQGAAKYTGQAAAMAATGAGQIQGLSNSWGQLQETLGSLIKSVVHPLAAALKGVVDAFLWLPEPVQKAAIALAAFGLALEVLNLKSAATMVALNKLVALVNVDVVMALKNAAAAVLATNFASLGSGIAGAAANLKGLTAGLGAANLAMIELAAAVAIGYAIGKGIEYLAEKYQIATKEERELSSAELEAQGVHLKSKYGIELTTDALRIWNQLSAEARHKLAEQAKAAGDAAISVDTLRKALQDLQAAQAAANDTSFWDATAKFYEDRVRFFSQNRRTQLVEEINLASRARDAAEEGSDDRKKAERDLQRLTSQLAQEDVRAAQEGGRQHAEAAKRAKEAWTSMVEAANEAFRKFKVAAREAAEKAAQDMTLAVLKISDPMAAAKLEAQMRAADFIDIQKKAFALGLITREEYDARVKQAEQRLQDDLAKINLEGAQKIAADETARQQKEDSDRQSRISKLKAEMQQILDNVSNPIQKVVNDLLVSFGPKVAAMAQQLYTAMQPIGNAITQLLTGAKVKWATVLRQMAAQFVSILVNQVLAGIVKAMVMFIFGEKAKQKESIKTTGIVSAQTLIQEYMNYRAAGSSILAAIAAVFKAHAGLMWVGVAVAIGFIALMMGAFSSMKGKTKAMSRGALVTEPELALIGESGPEFVAPAQDFKTVVASLVQDTLETVRVAARTVVPVNQRFAGAGGAAGGPGAAMEPHFHGFALVDTGEREMLGRTNRMLERARRDAKSLTFSDGDYVGS